MYGHCTHSTSGSTVFSFLVHHSWRFRYLKTEMLLSKESITSFELAVTLKITRSTGIRHQFRRGDTIDRSRCLRTDCISVIVDHEKKVYLIFSSAIGSEVVERVCGSFYVNFRHQWDSDSSTRHKCLWARLPLLPGK